MKKKLTYIIHMRTYTHTMMWNILVADPYICAGADEKCLSKTVCDRIPRRVDDSMRFRALFLSYANFIGYISSSYWNGIKYKTLCVTGVSTRRTHTHTKRKLTNSIFFSVEHALIYSFVPRNLCVFFLELNIIVHLFFCIRVGSSVAFSFSLSLSRPFVLRFDSF